MIVCKRVHYTGRVQGVGFRYTVQGLSRDYAVTGTVRNCADGSVEVMAQGDVVQVQSFFAAIERRMAGYIADQTVEDVEPISVQGFKIIA